MKLFRVVAIFDGVVVADDDESAKATLASAIDGGHVDGLKRMQALELRERATLSLVDWEGKAIVSNVISDVDYESLKGKNVKEILEQLYTKQI